MDEQTSIDCLGRRLTVAARCARNALDEALASSGVTFAGYLTLAELGRHGPCMQRELAQVLTIEAPTLTRQLDRLVAGGLVDRGVGSSRRSHRVALSTAGRQRLAEIDRIVAAADERLQSRLNPRQRDQLTALLQQLG